MTPPVGAPTAWLVEPARPADAPGLGALFRGADCPCHCRYFHFEGDKNAWLDRCANDVDANRLAFEDALVRGDDDRKGALAGAHRCGRNAVVLVAGCLPNPVHTIGDELVGCG